MSDPYDFINTPDPPPPAPALRAVPYRGGKVPQVDPAEEYLELQGSGPFELVLKGAPTAPLLVRARDPLKGSTRGEGCGLLLKDGTAHVVVDGVVATGNLHGIRLRGCQHVTLRNCTSHHNAIEGIIWGGCVDCAAEDCQASNNGRIGARNTALREARADRLAAAGSQPADRCHGLYVSFHSTGIRLVGCRSTSNTGLGLHVNGTVDEPGPPLRGLEVANSRFANNGSGGSGNCDLNYLSGATFTNCLFAAGVGLLSTWDDGAGDPRKGAKGVVVDRCTFWHDGNPNHVIKVMAGGQVEFRSCIIASRRSPAVTVSADSTAMFDAITLAHRAEGEGFAKAAAWVEAGSYRSTIPGVGYGG